MKFGFIGTGNMAGALVRALAKQSDSIALANRTPTKAETLAAEVGGVVWRNEEVAAQCQYIFLGVKPNLLESVLAPLAPILQTRPQDFVLVSMASGVTIAEVQAMAGGPYPVIRIMPNTPAAVGAGMILYCCSGNVTAAQRAEFLTAMQDAGAFDCLEEQLMDAGSAVSGCGPAFVYLFLEAMADGKAIVCSNIRGNVDLVKDGKGGLVVRNDAESVAAALKELIENQRLREEMGAYNMKAAEMFREENSLKKVCILLQDL